VRRVHRQDDLAFKNCACFCRTVGRKVSLKTSREFRQTKMNEKKHCQPLIDIEVDILTERINSVL
jgi:hypothetical protein